MNENTSSVDRVAADGNAVVSDMPADNNNDIVSGGDENVSDNSLNIYNSFE